MQQPGAESLWRLSMAMHACIRMVPPRIAPPPLPLHIPPAAVSVFAERWTQNGNKLLAAVNRPVMQGTILTFAVLALINRAVTVGVSVQLFRNFGPNYEGLRRILAGGRLAKFNQTRVVESARPQTGSGVVSPNPLRSAGLGSLGGGERGAGVVSEADAAGAGDGFTTIPLGSAPGGGGDVMDAIESYLDTEHREHGYVDRASFAEAAAATGFELPTLSGRLAGGAGPDGVSVNPMRGAGVAGSGLGERVV
jgi:hypothetical protein